MTTLTISELENILAGLDLSVPIPNVSNADVLNKPLDLARSYLADILSSLAGCDLDTAYESIKWPNDIYKGDVQVILPKLRPKSNAAELAFDLKNRVSKFLFS